MYYETPQFIREETKFFGIITFTQLGILTGVGAIIIILFYSPIPKFISVLLTIIIAPLGLVITFLEIGGVKIYRLIPDILRHFFLPRHYLWKKEEVNTFYGVHQSPKTPYQSPQPLKTKKTIDSETIKKLSQLLDQ